MEKKIRGKDTQCLFGIQPVHRMQAGINVPRPMNLVVFLTSLAA
jgi:hypothetical protein